MSYDHWKATNPNDEWLGPAPDEPDAYAPCPCCFESSGYEWQHGTDWESGPWSVQTNIPCRECNGSGLVPADAVPYHDDRADDFLDPGYERSLREQMEAV